MGLILKLLSVVLLVGCLAVTVATAGELACNGSYKGRKLTPEELETVLRNHYQWQETQDDLNDARRANLCQADLTETNLQKAKLRLANLQQAKLIRTDLQEADLVGANFQGAYLPGAKLQKAYLSGADLQEAFLVGADLQEANLSWANLQEANLMDANLRKVIYEPLLGKLPMFWTLTAPENQLETLRFRRSPAALIELREAFKKGGMRMQERQLTYAIEHTKMLMAWDPSWNNPFKLLDTRPWVEKLAGKSESLFNWVLFELPSGHGLAPGRALWTLLGLIPLFALLYWIALEHPNSRSGIWMIVPADRIARGRGHERVTRIRPQTVKTWTARLISEVRLLRTSLYFSLLSAFHLGWRELNVGTWITRMQPREYTLRATGWVRTVSGLQSLLSVYLLALWVLTYFGRPFE